MLQPGVVVALPEHQLFRVALFQEDCAPVRAAKLGPGLVQSVRRRAPRQSQLQPTESENARRLGYTGRQAYRARSAVLAGRLATGVRLRARVFARMPSAVSCPSPAAARSARHPGQGRQTGHPAPDPVVSRRPRAALERLYQSGHVRARGTSLVTADTPTRPVGRRPVREPGVSDERRRAPAVHAIALRRR